jgi:hypothetical protein
LSRLAGRAETACNGAAERYINTRAKAVVEPTADVTAKCFANASYLTDTLKRGLRERFDLSKLKNSLLFMESELDQLSRTSICQGIIKWGKEHFEDCNSRRDDLKKFVNEWT